MKTVVTTAKNTKRQVDLRGCEHLHDESSASLWLAYRKEPQARGLRYFK
jgi:hypothetical protein